MHGNFVLSHAIYINSLQRSGIDSMKMPSASYLLVFSRHNKFQINYPTFSNGYNDMRINSSWEKPAYLAS